MPLTTLTVQVWLDGDDDTTLTAADTRAAIAELLERLREQGLITYWKLG